MQKKKPSIISLARSARDGSVSPQWKRGNLENCIAHIVVNYLRRLYVYRIDGS